MKLLKFLLPVLGLTLGLPLNASAQSVQPVFRVLPHSDLEPTGDKPQSKLWYAQGSWWALLPSNVGQTLWKRTEDGWQDDPAMAEMLKGVRGRADIWPQTDQVTAVSVDQRRNEPAINIFRLTYDQGWTGELLTKLSLPEGKEVAQPRTATIARDADGHWWVAADVGTKVCVWNSQDAIDWSEPKVLGDDVKDEDICLVTPLPEGIGVLWTDQVKDRLVIREHVDGAPPDEWKPETVIEEGGNAADNHLKAVLSKDGVLWVATKNSVDQVGQPQLVLLERSPEGKWRKFPYAPRKQGLIPSRPAIFLTPDPKVLLLGHNIYNRVDDRPGDIEFGAVDLNGAGILKDPHVVIRPEVEPQTKFIRNITGPKLPFPAEAPWIILAADSEGNIYEADLKNLVQNP